MVTIGSKSSINNERFKPLVTYHRSAFIKSFGRPQTVLGLNQENSFPLAKTFDAVKTTQKNGV